MKVKELKEFLNKFDENEKLNIIEVTEVTDIEKYVENKDSILLINNGCEKFTITI